MSLDELRHKIDAVDAKIVQALQERVRLAIEVGKVKMASGQEIYVPSREEEVFAKILRMNEGHIGEQALRRIWREIISDAIAKQRPSTIAYLGPEATYTHQAALKNFGTSMPYVPLRSVPDVFLAVKRGEADFGVVPIENSTQGTVISSLDMLVETDLKIVAQIYLEISHSLISHARKLEDIKTVYSKDNALGQCREWLSRMMPWAELEACASTAYAVKYVSDQHDAAAIASPLAAEKYEVPILADSINDKEDNITRFLVIGKKSSSLLGQGRDRTSLVFTLNDEPGALLKALQGFGSRGINLCKIESRPSRRRAWDYYFYIDIIGHIEDAPVKEALKELEALCPMVKWLGSYPQTTA